MKNFAGIFLKSIVSYDVCREYVETFYTDPVFSDFRFANLDQIQHNLQGAIAKGNGYGVFRADKLIGIFGLLVIPEEKYIEMTVGLSEKAEAYEAVFQFLEEKFGGYQMDFVFNPQNYLLKDILTEKGAEFDTEQQKMVLQNRVPDIDTDGVVPFAQQYREEYIAIHNTDMYWTAEKVINAPDRFRTFLALHQDQVVGYIDVTHCFDENEPYDLIVLPEYRRRGYGRKLLAAALKANRPNAMMLLTEVDNDAAIHLYCSMGFVKAENENCLTAHWTESSTK